MKVMAVHFSVPSGDESEWTEHIADRFPKIPNDSLLGKCHEVGGDRFVC